MRFLRLNCLLLLFVALSALTLRAQESLQLGKHTVLLPDNVQHVTRGSNALELGHSSGNKYNVLVQLSAIPSEQERGALAARGLQLGDYLGNRAYWATLPAGIDVRKAFHGTSLRTVLAVAPEWKVAELLTEAELPEWSRVDEHTAKLELTYAANVTDTEVQNALVALGAKKVNIAKGWALASCEITRSAIDKVAALPWVLSIAPVPAPATLLNRTGASLSRANVLSVPNALGGRNLTGEGVRVGIWDGNVVYSPDFGNRVTRREYQLWQGGELHGTHVAGTVLGSGMSDPLARGMAPKAKAWTWNFSSSSDEVQEWQEMERCHQQDGITLTQNSYGLPLGQMCLFYRQFSYNTLGRDIQMDELVNKYPSLLPVYACGNDGAGCADSVLAHYGEKQYGTIPNRAKNSFFVGACDLIGRLGAFSSCGPLDDGRLAPHVVAKGVGVLSTNVFAGSSTKTGTSMACPTVTGNLALVTQRYKQLNGDRDPRADLLRALAMNTATDAGVVGPDYKYGYGWLNSEKMVLALERGYYNESEELTLKQGETKEFTIPVPANAKQARVMIAWNDATTKKIYKWGDKALVNDLDLTVNGLLPWVCDPSKGKVSLPATRKVDNLNNQEQVTLDATELKGKNTLSVKVTASTVPNGEQRFVLVWWFEEDAKTYFTAPLAGDQYAPGEIIIVHVENYASRWTDAKIPSTLEISYDGGKTFGHGYTLEDSYSGYRFDIPRNAPATAEAMLRLTDNAGGVVLSEKFTIAPVPENVSIARNDGCDNTFTLSWKQPPIVPAKGYALLIGDADAETWTPVANIPNNVTTFDIAPYVQPYLTNPKVLVAMAAQLGDSYDGKLGRRTTAIQLFSYAPLKLDVTKLPYNETFQNWPLPYMAIKHGSQRKYSVNAYSESFVPQGSNLFQVDIDAFAQKPYDASKPPFDPANDAYLFEMRFCKIDMSAIPEGEEIVLRIRGAVIACDQNKPKTSAFRVLWDNNVIKDARGLDIIYGKDTDVELVYVLKSDKGVHSLRLQHEGRDYNRYAADRLLVTGIYFEKPYRKHDVGLAITKTPVDGANLGLSTFTLTLVNGSLNEEKDLKLNYFRNGKWVSSQKLPTLPPYDDRQMEYEVDLSTTNPEGEDINVEFTLDCKDDDYLQDNRAKETVRNLGNIIPMPASYFLPKEYDPQQLPQDPKLRYTIGKGKYIFTDNGGLHANYSKSQDATITLVPEDPSMKVRVTFKKFKTGYRAGILSIYTDLNVWDEDTGMPSDQLDDDLTEKLAQDPYVYVSGSTDGSLRIHFESDNFEKTDEGWVAEVDLVPVTNPLTLVSAIAENDKADAEKVDVPVTVQIRNNTRRVARNAGIRVEGNGRFELVQEIASIPAGLSNPQLLDKKIENIPIRTARQVKVRLLGLDGDVSDNLITTWLLCDRYKFPQWKPVTGDQEEHHVDFRKEPLTVYKADGKARTGFGQLEHEDEMYLRVWVDWNDDGVFGDDEVEVDYTENKIQPNSLVLYFDVDVSKRPAGKYRLRAMYNSRDGEEVKNLYATNLDNETQVRDYIINVVDGSDPFAGDLLLTYIGTKDPSTGASPKVSKDFTDKEPLWIEIKNGSPKEFAGKFDVMISVDDKPAVTEEVEVPASAKLTAWSGTYKTKLNTTADLSAHGRHTIKVEIKEKVGGKPDNNKMAIELFKLKTFAPGQELEPWCLRSQTFVKGREKLVDKITVDQSAQRLWNAMPASNDPANLPAFTVEFWINPSRPHYGPILQGGGFEISTTYQSRATAVRDNGIMVFLGTRAVAFTKNEKADLIKPKQWTHVAVSIYNIKRAAAFGSGACDVKIFINGEEVEVLTDQKDAPSLNLGFTLLNGFDGMIDEFRIWSTQLTAERIKKFMYKHTSTGTADERANLIAEYSFDEGLGNAATEAQAPHYDMAYLESRDNRLAMPDSVWVDPRKAMLGEILFKDQVRAEKVANGKYKLTFLAVADLEHIKKVALETAWNNTKLTYNGALITESTEFDFSGNKEVKIKASVEIFGKTYEQEVSLTGVKEKSAETKILSATLDKTLNTTLTNTLTATIAGSDIVFVLNSTDGTLDVQKAKFSFVASADAVVHLLGRDAELNSGDEVDLSAARLLIVKAANGRSEQKYTLRLEQQQTVQWTEPSGEYSFGDAPVAIAVTSNTESLNPILGASDAPSVATVLNKKLYFAGVGEANISVYQAEGKSYLKSNVLTKKIKVTPKKIQVKPTTTEIVYGAPLQFTYAYEGLVAPEHQQSLPHPLLHGDYVFKKAGVVIGTYDATKRQLVFTQELLVGEYEIAAANAEYTVGNYTVKPVGATLKVTQGDSYALTFTVTSGGTPVVGAKVAVADRTYMTSAEGKVTVPVLKNAAYSYQVTKDGFIPVKGSVEVQEADKTEAISMVASAVTYEYKASAGGALFGKTTQVLAKGDTGLPVFAQADAGYHFTKWDDGSTENPRTDIFGEANKTITATFERNTYTVEFVADGNGTIEGTTKQEVAFEGSTTSVTAKPKEGYFFLLWSDGVTSPTRTESSVRENKTLYAIFRTQMQLPYSNNFESGTFPEGWATTSRSRSQSGKALAWKLTNHPTWLHDKLDGYFFIIDADKDLKADFEAVLYTPRFELKTHDTQNNLLFTCTSYYRDFEPPTSAAKVQYECGDGWKDLEKGRLYAWNSNLNVQAALKPAELAGKKYVQFRIVYEAKWSYWLLVDNVAIYYENKLPSVTLKYNSDPVNSAVFVKTEGGKKITLPVEDGYYVSKDCRYGQLPPQVTAIPAQDYKFWKWSDGVLTPTRPEQPATENLTLTALCMRKNLVHVSYRATIPEGAKFMLNGQEVTEQWIPVGTSTEPVEVVAMPGYSFRYWLPDESRGAKLAATEVSQDVVYTAVVVKEEFLRPASLSIVVNPSEGGTVELSTPDGKSLDLATSKFYEGDQVRGVCMPKEGFAFASATRNGVAMTVVNGVFGIELGAKQELVVNYAPKSEITMRMEPAEGGYIKFITTDSKEVTPEQNPDKFIVGSAIFLRVVPKYGWRLVKLIDESNNTTLEVDSDSEVHIVLKPKHTFVATFEKGTGIADVQDLGITLQPNPASDHLALGNVQEGDKLTVFSALGVVCLESTASNHTVLDVRTLNEGVYILRVQRGGVVNTLRFVKQ